MAHTYAYNEIGTIEGPAPGRVKKHLYRGQITLSTGGGDAYSRTTRISFTFPGLSLITEVIALWTDVQGNAGMIPVQSALAANVLTVALLESGPDTQGPLREKAEEAHDQAYNLYAVVSGH